MRMSVIGRYPFGGRSPNSPRSRPEAVSRFVVTDRWGPAGIVRSRPCAGSLRARRDRSGPLASSSARASVDCSSAALPPRHRRATWSACCATAGSSPAPRRCAQPRPAPVTPGSSSTPNHPAPGVRSRSPTAWRSGRGPAPRTTPGTHPRPTRSVLRALPDWARDAARSPGRQQKPSQDNGFVLGRLGLVRVDPVGAIAVQDAELRWLRCGSAFAHGAPSTSSVAQRRGLRGRGEHPAIRDRWSANR